MRSVMVWARLSSRVMRSRSAMNSRACRSRPPWWSPLPSALDRVSPRPPIRSTTRRTPPRRAGRSGTAPAPAPTRVTPEPHVVTTGRARSSRAPVKAPREAPRGEQGAVAARRLVVGRFRLPGMWPPRSPARGSGSVPAKRPRERASRIWRRAGCELTRTARRREPAPGGTSRANVPRRRARGAARDRPAFLTPLGGAAVEHRHRVVAEDAKCPPHARGAHDAARVVDDHPVAGADAERARPPSRSSRGGSMCGSALVWSAMASMSKKTAPGRWASLELGARVTLRLRHVPAAVHHAQVGLAEVCGQPLRA